MNNLISIKAILSLSVVAAFFSAASPDASGVPTKIDFMSDHYMNIEKYLINRSGAGQTRLLQGDMRESRTTVPGTLDPTFGSGGIVSMPNAWPSSIALLSDGKMLVDINGIERFLPDGRLDITFGIDGSGVLPDDFFGSITAIAVQTDGRILVGGSQYLDGNHQFSIIRLSTDGFLDQSFGTNGRVITPMGSEDAYLRDLLLQPDGKFVAAGSSAGFAIARYNTDGSLDDTFGVGGKIVTRFSGRYDAAQSAAIERDGKLLVAGTTDNDMNLNIARYDQFGKLDLAFGQGGFIKVPSDQGFGWSPSVALRHDGRIVLGGCKRIGGGFDFALFGFTSSGIADATFGTNGTVITNIAGNSDCIRSVLFQPDGKLVVAGQAGNFYTSSFGIARYLPDGSLDTTFGKGGSVLTDLSPDNEVATDMALQPDGRLLVTGFTDWIDYGDDDANLAIVRYQNQIDVGVSISGRVRSPWGAALRNVAVSLVDSSGNGRTVTTGSFGLFMFENVTLGREYALTASSKRYRFAPRLITTTENTEALELIATE